LKTGGGRACFLCGSRFHLQANSDRKPSTNSVRRVNQTSAQHCDMNSGSAGHESVTTTGANVNIVQIDEKSDFSADNVPPMSSKVGHLGVKIFFFG